MVQGQDTDPAAVAEIRDAVRSGSEASVRLLNYKKNGQPFWNMFTLAPMADVDGNLRFIIGVQVPLITIASTAASGMPYGRFWIWTLCGLTRKTHTST